MRNRLTGKCFACRLDLHSRPPPPPQQLASSGQAVTIGRLEKFWVQIKYFTVGWRTYAAAVAAADDDAAALLGAPGVTASS